MKLGIFAKTFAGHKPNDVLRAAAAAGFSAVQYNMACSGLPSMPDEISSATTQEVALAESNNGIDVVALSGTYNMIHPDAAMRMQGHERLAVLAAAAPAMKTNLITLCTGTRDMKDQWRDHPDNRGTSAWRDLLASMQVAIGIAEQHDIYLGIEPELANVINSAQSARRLLDEMQSPRLKIVLDPANLFETATLALQRRLVSEAIDLLADSIVMGHAKDRTATGEFTAAGKGVLDYEHYFTRLKRIDFNGAIVTHGLAANEAAEVASFLQARVAQIGFRLEQACLPQ
jgi:sugar phosphate isomerase/epimerase